MENQNIENNQLENSSVPFVNHFSKLRENPKWLVKLLILIVLGFLTKLVQIKITDQAEFFKLKGVDSSNLSKMNFDQNIWMQLLGVIPGIIFNIAIVFIIFLIISKIMKSNVKGKSLLSASLSYCIIVNVFSLAILCIQALFGLHIPTYQLDSLNIFNPGNVYLAAFSLTNLLSAFIVGIVLYATSHLSKKAAIIWAIIALIVTILLTMGGAWFTDLSINMMNNA
ncbi:YIP1 family protein [Staphylococcus capitis]|uniref:YIP1 family protein n=1 Tax=Staphylococcus capitis TaxID=29388 RepID=UPI00345B870D